MNTNITIKSAAILLLACVSVAAEYSIDWQILAGAGGTASGGAYAVRDTLGETVAHRTSVAPSAAIDGGFWARWSPISFGLPVLQIERVDSDTARLSWAPEGGGWVLQRSTDLHSWTDLTADSPAEDPISGRTFYRLTLP